MLSRHGTVVVDERLHRIRQRHDLRHAVDVQLIAVIDIHGGSVGARPERQRCAPHVTMEGMRRLSCVVALGLLAAGCSGDGGRAAPATTAVAPTSSAGSTVASSAPASSPRSEAPAASVPAPESSAVPAKEGKPRLEPVGTFRSPIHLSAPRGDDRLYVVEQRGVVRLVDGGTVRAEPFLDISEDVKAGGEQGLLSIAFSPAYAEDGHVYVSYTDNEGDSRIVEFTRGAGDTVDKGTRRELLKIDQPYPNHNGGLVIFDPSGMLLIGLGDGGSGGDPQDRGQDLGEHLGKLLRIDPRPQGDKPYRIPADNPFVGREGARPEIWAYGVRNPWRFSFGPDGTFFLADVGQNALEEVNAVAPDAARGANYGWSVFEGDRRFKATELTEGGPLIEPSLTYDHDGGRCSVTGGGVYTGSVAQLRGHYLYADYCSGEVWAAAVNGTRLSDPQLVFTVPGAASFGIDSAGEMYVVSNAGSVQRITA